VLIPKYQRRIFKNTHVARGCRLAFYDIAERYRYKILTLEIMEDQVHIFLEMHPIQSIFTFPMILLIG
jgi:putative transposase